MNEFAKWFNRPHRWVLVLFMFLTYKSGMACLVEGAPESALDIFKAAVEGMIYCLGIIGIIKKAPDMLRAATGKK